MASLARQLATAKQEADSCKKELESMKPTLQWLALYYKKHSVSCPNTDMNLDESEPTETKAESVVNQPPATPLVPPLETLVDLSSPFTSPTNTQTKDTTASPQPLPSVQAESVISPRQNLRSLHLSYMPSNAPPCLLADEQGQ